MILIFGKHGQLAQSFKATVPSSLDGKTVFVSSIEANFEKPELLHGFLDHQSPEVVVLCSAYAQVDRAEEEKHLAETLNVRAPQEIARWCSQNGILLIHFSTDYVFDGHGQKPWKEDDDAEPLNWYGQTKLDGEEAIRFAGCPYVILRTSWIFSEYGKNFVRTMLKLGMEKTHLRIVDDQVGSPTYAPDLAMAAWSLVERAQAKETIKSGVYHLTGRGYVSWAGFAEEIFSQARAMGFPLTVETVEKVPSSEYATPAKRPLNSRLDLSKVKKVHGLELPLWQDSLSLCLKRIGVPREN